MKTKSSRQGDRKWHIRALLIFLYAVLLTAVLLVEFRHELFPTAEASASEEEHGAAEDFGYRLLTGAGYRSHRARNVRLVLLDPATEGDAITTNLCVQRQFLSVVLENLLASGVAGIVVDKHFSKSACSADDRKTQALVKVLTTSKVPITIGLHTAERRRGGEPFKIVLSDLLDPLSAPPMLKFGVTLLNRDTRKLPLEWPISIGGNATLFPTLALAAATAKDQGVTRELEPLLSTHRHPYTTFMSRTDLPRWSAAAVYCLNASVRFDSIDCSRERHDDMDLRGKIAIVGAANGDSHSSPLGEVPGAELHANYVEALLQQDYFEPLPHWLCLLLLGLGAGAIQLAFWQTTKPGKTLLWCAACGVTAAAVGYFSLVQLQVLMPPVYEMGGLFAFAFLRYVDTHGHNLAHSMSPAVPATHGASPAAPAPTLPTPNLAAFGVNAPSSNPPPADRPSDEALTSDFPPTPPKPPATH